MLYSSPASKSILKLIAASFTAFLLNEVKSRVALAKWDYLQLLHFDSFGKLNEYGLPLSITLL